MSANEVCLCLVIIVLFDVIFWQRFGKRVIRYWAERKPKVKRRFSLRAKNPNDCADCVAGRTSRQVNPAPAVTTRPYAEIKKPGVLLQNLSS